VALVTLTNDREF